MHQINVVMKIIVAIFAKNIMMAVIAHFVNKKSTNLINNNKIYDRQELIKKGLAPFLF